MVPRVPNAQLGVDVRVLHLTSIHQLQYTSQGLQNYNTFSRDVVSILSKNSENKIYVGRTDV
jgi:hypothetical protein